MSQTEPLGNAYEIGSPPPPNPGLRLVEQHRISRWQKHHAAAEILPDERVSTCHMHTMRGKVSIMKHRERGSVFYGGLMVCGSVWACPICASKISEKRKVDLVAGIETWKDRGGQVHLLTLTAPHYQGDGLKGLVDRFRDARRRLRRSKTWRMWAPRINLQGSVCAIEVTYGENGWHVHTHEILFTEPGDRKPIAEDILAAWQRACVAAGLEIPNHHGVEIGDGSKAGSYASKWGMEHELTKAHIKKGNQGGSTPWDFLTQYHEGEKEISRSLFKEYACAFKGRRQLVWSKGTRDLLGLDPELTDEDLAAIEEDQAEVIVEISREDWKIVVRYQVRGELLNVARERGGEGVVEYIAALRTIANKNLVTPGGLWYDTFTTTKLYLNTTNIHNKGGNFETQNCYHHR